MPKCKVMVFVSSNDAIASIKYVLYPFSLHIYLVNPAQAYNFSITRFIIGPMPIDTSLYVPHFSETELVNAHPNVLPIVASAIADRPTIRPD